MAILIVEDNADLGYGLRNNLEIEGYEVDVARDGPSGLIRARSLQPDLVILDLMLPGLDGYLVLETLRDDGLDMPLLILTAHGQEADKVRGFRLGADDYVTKPFGLLELMARIGALLRRAGRRHAPSDIPQEAFGAIEIDPATRSVHRNGAAVPLTPMEFDLLIALLKRRGSVASRLELLQELWGHSSAILTRTVYTHIAELRRKLEADPSEPENILTVRKAGYRLQR